MNVDKSLMTDSRGKFFTQGLFLEIGYSKFSMYTLKEQDHEYKGTVYPSIKKLYLAYEDPTEYDFANKYFVSWNHWQRICDNVILRKHIDEWRQELELKIRSQAIRDIMSNSADGSYQASKYLAERGWDKNVVGRPNKATKARDAKMDELIDEEFSSDIKRMDRLQ